MKIKKGKNLFQPTKITCAGHEPIIFEIDFDCYKPILAYDLELLLKEYEKHPTFRHFLEAIKEIQ